MRPNLNCAYNPVRVSSQPYFQNVPDLFLAAFSATGMQKLMYKVGP